jgi:plastocyanin
VTSAAIRGLLLGLLALGGCSGGGGAAGAESAGTVVEVEATGGFAFAPAHLTIPLGTTVRWTNKGVVPHTITSGASSRPADRPGALLDHKLASGATVEMTFASPGDWPYFCRYHEGMGMVGVVTVLPAQGGGGAPGGTEQPYQRLDR